MTTETATLAGGCFWCLQPIFQELKGVLDVECGYSGGSSPTPTYDQVCTGTTGHAEVVQVTFDPAVISFEDVLRVFFTVHDPTTSNRQGPDVGSQYRSAIFHHSQIQKDKAVQQIVELGKHGPRGRPIVTEVVPFKAFYRAEEYHQNYFRKNPDAGYCAAVIAPKVTRFREQFHHNLKE